MVLFYTETCSGHAGSPYSHNKLEVQLADAENKTDLSQRLTFHHRKPVVIHIQHRPRGGTVIVLQGWGSRFEDVAHEATSYYALEEMNVQQHFTFVLSSKFTGQVGYWSCSHSVPYLIFKIATQPRCC